MSRRRKNILSLAGVDFNNKSEVELRAMFDKAIHNGMHGLCFSPYLDGQEPGDQISAAQIRQRMEIIKSHTSWVRSFSCTDGNQLIPQIAHECGLKTLVGAWLGKDDAINKKEIENAIKIAKEGHVDVLAVGNEVMYRGDLSEDELLSYIHQVKKELPNIPVGYVDAYYEFENRPQITNACDVILANCYPFWEGCSLEHSFLYMKDMYHRALKIANGKKVIISETGWPNVGETFYGAKPGTENAMRYFINAQIWSAKDNIDMFYFSSFDEAWKTSDEGDVGAYWGLWDKEGRLKYGK